MLGRTGCTQNLRESTGCYQNKTGSEGWRTRGETRRKTSDGLKVASPSKDIGINEHLFSYKLIIKAVT